METTVEVAYVNQPKQPGWSGSIKTADGQFFGVKEADLSKFQKGGKYSIQYVEKAKDGKIYRDFVSMGTALASPAPNIDRDYANRDVQKPIGSIAHGPTHYSVGDPKERGMFIMGVVGRSMGSGKFEAAEIATLTRIAADAYDEVFSVKSS